jgi:hypothetical protein
VTLRFQHLVLLVSGFVALTIGVAVGGAGASLLTAFFVGLGVAAAVGLGAAAYEGWRYWNFAHRRAEPRHMAPRTHS